MLSEIAFALESCSAANALLNRFLAVVEIEQLLHDNPHKKLLVRALDLKHSSKFDSVTDLFLNEMLLTGTCSDI